MTKTAKWLNGEANGLYGPINALGKRFDIQGAYSMHSIGSTALVDLNKIPTKEVSFLGQLVTIPKATDLIPQTEFSHFTSMAESRTEFQQSVSRHASASGKTSAFGGEFGGEFDVAYGSQSRDTVATSYLYDCVTAPLGRASLSQVPAEYLADSFLEWVGTLPDTCTAGNQHLFDAFFHAQGTHYLTSMKLGGDLRLYTSVEKSTSVGSQDLQAFAKIHFDGLFTSGKFEYKETQKASWDKYFATFKSTILGHGGDPGHLLKLVGNNGEKPDVDAFAAWVTSLKSDPALSDFGLSGIWGLCGNPKKQAAVEAAYNVYLAKHRKRIDIARSGFHTAIYLDGALLKEPDHPLTQSTDYGWRLTSVRISDMTVLYDECFGYFPGYWADDSKKMYAKMKASIDSRRLTSTQGTLLIVSIYGGIIQPAYGASIVPSLREAGAGANKSSMGEMALVADTYKGMGSGALAFWKDWLDHTGDVNRPVDYILVGLAGGGVGKGIEWIRVTPWDKVKEDWNASAYVYLSEAGGGAWVDANRAD